MFETQIWTAKILFFSEIPKYYWIFFSFFAFFLPFDPLSSLIFIRNCANGSQNAAFLCCRS